MARGPCPFRPRALTAAIKAAQAAGLKVGRTEIAPDGRIVLVFGEGEAEPICNPWDAVLSDG
jgi:hypothetical protein